MSVEPLHDDPVWRALEGLRDTEPVRQARGYAATRARRRQRITALRDSLRAWWPAVPAAAALAALAIFLLQPRAQIFETDVGQMRRVALQDGSVVTLNTGSRLQVRYGWYSREAQLLTGEAQFDIARDPSRPFRVTANEMSVTALGTSFDVIALSSRTAVTLIDGHVLVEATTDTDGARAHQLGEPGQQVRLAGNGLSDPIATRLDATLAWRRQQIDLSALTLTEALEEVNRYSTVRLVVAEPDLHGARISGVFRAGDVDGFADALTTYFGLHVLLRSEREIVLGRTRAEENGGDDRTH